MILDTDVIRSLYGKSIEYTENDIITFEKGILGFPELKKYIFIGNISEDIPYCFLQSIENESVSFIITNPFLFKKDYDFLLDEKYNCDKIINLKNINQLNVYSILNINKEVKNSTINLKAPIIINIDEKKGMQIILEEEYDIKYKIYK